MIFISVSCRPMTLRLVCTHDAFLASHVDASLFTVVSCRQMILH